MLVLNLLPLLASGKNRKKTFNPPVFLLLYDFLSLKNDVTGSGSFSQRQQHGYTMIEFTTRKTNGLGVELLE